jgi:hypothetical protein
MLVSRDVVIFPGRVTMSLSIKCCVLILSVLCLFTTVPGCSDDSVRPEPEPAELLVAISYHDSPNKDLKYVEKVGQSWGKPEVVHYGGNVGQHSSLALDARGTPHICYYDFGNGDLMYAVRTEDGWARTTVDWEGTVGNRCSLALDAQGNPHICYMDETHGLVKYAWNTGGAWDTTTVANSAIFGGEVPCITDWGHPTSIAIDAGGTPHMSYYTAWTFDLGYITKVNGELVVVAADGGEDNVGMASSLALDSGGRPHISYLEYAGDNDFRLKYAHKTDGEWSDERIPVSDQPNDCVGPTSIAVDADGTVHICYFTDPKDSGSLGYVVKRPGGNWDAVIAASQGDVGYYCSIAVDAQKNPHISYWDRLNQNLRCAECVDNDWTSCVVDDAPGVGFYSSIDLCYR